MDDLADNTLTGSDASCPASAVTSPPIDVVVTVFNEKPGALAATLAAIRDSKACIRSIVVVDDGSDRRVSLDAKMGDLPIRLLRLKKNSGISAARNEGLKHCCTDLVACINCEILVADDWFEKCAAALAAGPRIGASFSRMVPAAPERLTSKWMDRFQSQRHPDRSGAAHFAPGHAVLFRRAALDAVGGYDVRHRLIAEDYDISRRITEAGWTIQYVSDTRVVSIQEVSIRWLAHKQLLRYGLDPRNPQGRTRILRTSIKELCLRMARNTLTFRWRFLPVDVLIFGWGVIFLTRASRRGMERREI